MYAAYPAEPFFAERKPGQERNDNLLFIAYYYGGCAASAVNNYADLPLDFTR